MGHFQLHDHRDLHNLVEASWALVVHTRACQPPCPELDDCNVGARLSSPHLHSETGPAQQGQRSPCQCTATGEFLWFPEQDQRKLSLHHDRDVDDHKLQLRNLHSFLHCHNPSTCCYTTTGVSTVSKNNTCGISLVFCTVCTVGERRWSTTEKSTTLSMNWSWDTSTFTYMDCWSLSLYDHKDVCNLDELYEEVSDHLDKVLHCGTSTVSSTKNTTCAITGMSPPYPRTATAESPSCTVWTKTPVLHNNGQDNLVQELDTHVDDLHNRDIDHHVEESTRSKKRSQPRPAPPQPPRPSHRPSHLPSLDGATTHLGPGHQGPRLRVHGPARRRSP